MNIETIRNKKKELEEKICKNIEEFESMGNVYVDDIIIKRNARHINTYNKVDVDCKIIAGGNK